MHDKTSPQIPICTYLNIPRNTLYSVLIYDITKHRQKLSINPIYDIE